MQPIRWRGWLRLWMVLSLVLVPVTTVVISQSYFDTWDRLDANGIKLCVDAEDGKPENDAMLCEKQLGIGKGYYERDHTTAWAFWGEGLGFVFALDVLLTGLIVAMVLAIRWVLRGFRSSPPVREPGRADPSPEG